LMIQNFLVVQVKRVIEYIFVNTFKKTSIFMPSDCEKHIPKEITKSPLVLTM